MKIGLVSMKLLNLGGHYQMLYLARKLQENGHMVTVFLLENVISDIDKSLIKDLRIVSCNYLQKPNKTKGQIMGFIEYVWYLFEINIILAKKIGKEDIDILNIHDWPLHWSGVFVKLIKNTPVVWTCNDVWHVSGQEELPEKRQVFYLGNKLLIGQIDIFFTLFTDKILVLSNMSKRVIKKHYKKDAQILPSGIDIESFEKLPPKENARKLLGLPQNRFVFLCLHAFFPHRRYEDVVNAFGTLRHDNKEKNCMLIINGSDAFMPSYAKKIKSLIKEKHLEKNVKITTRYLKRSELIDYLIACDVFILPHEKYMWGLLAIEAMVVGKPCIISSGTGVSEVIENGKTGLIFQVRNVSDLKEKMELLLKNAKLREKMGKRAHQYVVKNYSWDVYAQNMIKVFERIASARRQSL